MQDDDENVYPIDDLPKDISKGMLVVESVDADKEPMNRIREENRLLKISGTSLDSMPPQAAVECLKRAAQQASIVSPARLLFQR